VFHAGCIRGPSRRRSVSRVPAPAVSQNRGRGFLKHKIKLYPGWDSQSEDKKIEDSFEALRGTGQE
jgi:hypothetical protein